MGPLLRRTLGVFTLGMMMLAVPGAQAAPDLKAETEQGRRIAETVQATVAAVNALLAHPHAPPHANTFFVLRRAGDWYVYFGWLEKDGSRYTPALVMTAPAGKLEQMHQMNGAGSSAKLTAYARAVSFAQAQAAKATGDRHLDPVLFPTASGIDVYVIQGGPMHDAIRLGGDFLFHFDAQAKHLRAQVRFHKAVIRVPLADPRLPSGKTVGSYHTHVIDEEPTATDVAAAILHPALAPMVVIGRSGAAYRVDATGAMKLEPAFAATADVPLAAQDGGVVLAPAEALPANAR